MQFAETNADLGLARAMRGGGFIVYYRHERTEIDRLADAPGYRFEDCTAQRNLSVAGYAGARETGEALRRLGAPIGEVYSSPLCRCIETARVAFGRAVVEPRLLSSHAGMGRTSADSGRDLQGLLPQVYRQDTNVVLVSHFEPLSEAFGARINEGDIAVLAPDGEGRFKVVRTIVASRWGQALRDAAVLARR